MVTIRFHSELEDEKHLYLECIKNVSDNIVVIIENKDDEEDYKLISLDLKTAIKLDKELRRQIALIKEDKNE